jgi:hypothetical protein
VSSDSTFGSGTRTRIRQVNPGAFNLSFQIGGLAAQSEVTVSRTVLTPPRKLARISSWASIFE